MAASTTNSTKAERDASPSARNPGTPGQPMPQDEIPFKADVWRENGRIIGAAFEGRIATTKFDGKVKTGSAQVNVEKGNAFGSASTNGTSMDARVGLKTAMEHFEFSASFAPGGQLNGSGKVTVGDISFSFSNDSIGTEFKFDSGVTASLSRNTDGAWNANWNSPTVGGFQTSLSFGTIGGSWSINANFTLKAN